MVSDLARGSSPLVPGEGGGVCGLQEESESSILEADPCPGTWLQALDDSITGSRGLLLLENLDSVLRASPEQTPQLPAGTPLPASR